MWGFKKKKSPATQTGPGDRVEDAKIERLERAEAEVENLKMRAHAAIQILDGRRERNHWRESIQEMIQGV